jgi:hypothetical protein
MKDPQEVTMQNGRPATKGTCPVCGTSMFRIGSGSGSSAGGGSSSGGGAKASSGGAKASSGGSKSSSKNK